jgi:hypothetical protein
LISVFSSFSDSEADDDDVDECLRLRSFFSLYRKKGNDNTSNDFIK